MLNVQLSVQSVRLIASRGKMARSSNGQRIDPLPSLLDRKLYKTGQTRGATTREIYQNRVSRNSTVLIPQDFWEACRGPDDDGGVYESGSIALIKPSWYFSKSDSNAELEKVGLTLGKNALLLFEKRSDWVSHAPKRGSTFGNGLKFQPATHRIGDLGGTYIARVHSTTAAENGQAIVEAYNQTDMRGAGIRVYEYASVKTLAETRLQLEVLMWLCHDSIETMTETGMSDVGAHSRRDVQMGFAQELSLLDLAVMREKRMLDSENHTVCPLCQRRISAAEFMQRGEQAEGRETWDITVTEVSLFHVDELRVGKLQHKPYNLAWGHHYCNVVVKDAGIESTLTWMKTVLENNKN